MNITTEATFILLWDIKHRFKQIYRTVLILIALTFLINPFAMAQSETSVVVPNSLTNVEGNTQQSFPFNCNPGIFPNGMRNQQAYLDSEIAKMGFIVEIVGISFRSTEDQSEDPPVVIPQIQIDMSTTQAQPDNLSTTFAGNLGPDVTTVYSRPLSVSTPQCGAGPCPFSVDIPLQTPFIYLPADGNLIIDMRVPDCTLTLVALDASDTTENLEKTSRAISTTNGVDSPTANFVNDTGLVTELDIILTVPPRNVPTLSEWGLIAMASILGLVGFMVLRRRKVIA